MKASVEHIREKFAFTERRACRLLLVPVSAIATSHGRTTTACVSV